MRSRHYARLLFFCFFAIFIAGCLEESTTVSFYNKEPAIARFQNGGKYIETTFGSLLVPAKMMQNQISDLDTLIATFTLDDENNFVDVETVPYDDTIIYKKVSSSLISVVSGVVSDSYPDSIFDADIYQEVLDSLMFVDFEQHEDSFQVFNYKIFCNTDSVSDTTLFNGDRYKVWNIYVSSKRMKDATAKTSKIIVPFAFDIGKIASDLEVKNNKILFNLKYKLGVDKNGKDKYTSVADNPYIWDISRKKIYPFKKQ